jgi:Cu2+-containing amine oxidase
LPKFAFIRFNVMYRYAEGASFAVDGREVTWDKWTLRVGFNYREGLVLHDVKYDGRQGLQSSIVMMTWWSWLN